MSIEQAYEYRERSLHYISNATAMLRQSEAEKAGDLLWGALVQALKAVAALKDVRLRTHREIRGYARAAAKELNDERLLEVFSIAETMHSNFYEGFLDLGQMSYNATEVTRAIATLLALMPQDAS
ncbi:MAG: PaREP1 family protein [Chloroflexi bacterium]|nr:PaREP1 family protein [Chloroflexota bacterium]